MNQSDREIIISIVSSAFEQNPRAVAMMKKKNPARSVRLMTEYAYTLVEKFNGIYLSEDKTTVLFYYTKSQYKRGLTDYLRYARMFLQAIRFSQLFPTLRREKYIASLRPDYKDYIYVWVLGSVPNNKSLKGLADIRDHLFGLSEKLQLPILIETTVDKVRKLYHYVGFEEYHKWEDAGAGINVWFLKRMVHPPKRA
ncbi:MAG: hypothetical protein P1P86_10540 [Bacteroidales bacterium]|nr:hypothetical protein [Bacteroidales bacterium]